MKGNHTHDDEIDTTETIFIASGWYLVFVGIVGAAFNIRALVTAIKVSDVLSLYLVINLRFSKTTFKHIITSQSKSIQSLGRKNQIKLDPNQLAHMRSIDSVCWPSNRCNWCIYKRKLS